jgi:hypothetical protein
MSLDYSEYEELRKKNRLLGWRWRVGDIGYYFGLIGTIIWPLAVISHQFTNRTTQLPWDKTLLLVVLGTAFCFSIFWSAAQLKSYALSRGKKLKNKP